jgi:hypothetical protein
VTQLAGLTWPEAAALAAAGASAAEGTALLASLAGDLLAALDSWIAAERPA